MNIIDKIKTFFAVKSTAEDIYKEATNMTGTKPGWQTSEFYMTIAGQIGTLWGAVAGFIPPKYAAIISTAGIAVYTVARTILKAVSDVKAANASTGGDTATATVNVAAK